MGILLGKICSTHSLKFIKIKILAKVFTGILLENKNENPDFSTDIFFKKDQFSTFHSCREIVGMGQNSLET